MGPASNNSYTGIQSKIKIHVNLHVQCIRHSVDIYRKLHSCAEIQNFSLSVEKYFMSEHSELVKCFST